MSATPGQQQQHVAASRPRKRRGVRLRSARPENSRRCQPPNRRAIAAVVDADQVDPQRVFEVTVGLDELFDRLEELLSGLAVNRARVGNRHVRGIGFLGCRRGEVLLVIAVGNHRDAPFGEARKFGTQLVGLAGSHDDDVRRVREDGSLHPRLHSHQRSLAETRRPRRAVHNPGIPEVDDVRFPEAPGQQKRGDVARMRR